MISGLLSRIKGFLLAVAAGASIILGVFLWGKRAQRTEDRVEELEDYIQTKETIDAVETSDDPDAAFERLRRNGWVR